MPHTFRNPSPPHTALIFFTSTTAILPTQPSLLPTHCNQQQHPYHCYFSMCSVCMRHMAHKHAHPSSTPTQCIPQYHRPPRSGHTAFELFHGCTHVHFCKRYVLLAGFKFSQPLHLLFSICKIHRKAGHFSDYHGSVQPRR
jgi:hypothetical protein